MLDDWHPNRRVVVIGDDPSWTAQVVRITVGLDASPEIIPTADGSVELPLVSLVTFGHGADQEYRARLARWANRGLSALTLISSPPSSGLASLRAFLERRGFPPALVYHSFPEPDPEYRRDLTIRLTEHLSHRLWLVPYFIRVLGVPDPDLERVLSVAIRNPRMTTVDGWARASGLRRHGIDRMFRGLGIGPPKRLLAWLRLAQAVCERCESGLPRDDIAACLGYPNGDELGRRSRDLAGLPFGQLADAGLPSVLDRLVAPGGNGLP